MFMSPLFCLIKITAFCFFFSSVSKRIKGQTETYTERERYTQSCCSGYGGLQLLCIRDPFGLLASPYPSLPLSIALSPLYRRVQGKKGTDLNLSLLLRFHLLTVAIFRRTPSMDSPFLFCFLSILLCMLCVDLLALISSYFHTLLYQRYV